MKMILDQGMITYGYTENCRESISKPKAQRFVFCNKIVRNLKNDYNSHLNILDD